MKGSNKNGSFNCYFKNHSLHNGSRKKAIDPLRRIEFKYALFSNLQPSKYPTDFVLYNLGYDSVQIRIRNQELFHPKISK